MAKSSRKTIAAQEPRLIEMYQAGHSYAEIGAVLGLTEKGVSTRVRPMVAAGRLEARTGGNHGPQAKTRDNAAELVARYEAGKTWEQLAAELGMTLEGLRYRLHQAGVEPDRQTPRWEAAQHWPWPLTLAEVAQRLYGSQHAAERRHARMPVSNWLNSGKLVAAGRARYDLAPKRDKS